MTPPPNGDGTNKPEDDPLGGMDPMAWLESLARRQGANPDELTTAADLDVPMPSADTQVDAPGYTPGYESAAKPAAAAEPPPVPEPAPPPAPAAVDPSDPLGGMDPMAWLESLARRQGANVDELTTAADLDVPMPAADTVLDEPGYTPGYDSAPKKKDAEQPTETGIKPPEPTPLPPTPPHPKPTPAAPPPPSPEPAPDLTFDDPLGGADPMAWLESLARRQGANVDELTTAADLDVPMPAADAQSTAPGYTDFDPFSAGTLSPSARALEQPPPAAAQPESTSEDALGGADPMAWLESLAAKQGAPLEELPTMRAEAAPSTPPESVPLSDESDPMAWLASFGDPTPYDSVSDFASPSTDQFTIESMTPDAALSWLDSLSAEVEAASPPPSAPEGISPIEAGGLSNDPQEVQAWLTSQLGSLMQVRAEEDELPLPIDDSPAEPSSSLPDWLSEAIVDPTLPAARGALDPDIKLPTPPADLPTWLLESAEPAALDLDLGEDFLPEETPALEAIPEMAIELDPQEIERMIKPTSPEEVDDLAEYFNEEYDRRRAGDETIPLWYLEALQRAESAPLPEPTAQPPAEPEPEFTFAPLGEGDMPDWLKMMQPEPEVPVAPEPALPAAVGTEGIDWLDALTEGMSEEEPAPATERPEWLAPTGSLDPSVVERFEAEQAARTPEPPPAPVAQPAPAYVPPTPPPTPPAPAPAPMRSAAVAASLGQARQQVAAGQVLPALESYQALVDSMENLEDVRADLRQLAEQHPKEPKVRRLLGDTHMRLGDLQAALDTYLNALKEL